MKINFHAVNFKITAALKGHIEEKLTHIMKVFHRVDSVNVFLKVEKKDCISEVMLKADDVNLYLSEAADDMYKSIDIITHRLTEIAHKAKERQKSHKTKEGQHHNHVVFTKNVQSKQDLDEETDIFSNKPLSRLEAFLELRLSNNNIIIFKDIDDLSFNIMLKEHDVFFLIRKETSFLKSLFGKAKIGYVQYTLQLKKEKLLVVSKKKYVLKESTRAEAFKEVAKNDFCIYLEPPTGNFNVLFKYGRNKIGLVEKIAIQ